MMRRMLKRMLRILQTLQLVSLCWLMLGVNSYAATEVPLTKVTTQLRDYAALQRGSQIFVNRCQPCHSLNLMRYDSLAYGIKITDEEGKILEDIIQNNLMFDSAGSLVSTMQNYIAADDAISWFGINPPDLSLVTRSRGKDWVYSFLRGFYRDSNKPLGTNNIVFPDVGMPHVLLDWQGEQIIDPDNHLRLTKSGKLSPAEFDAAVTDLVSFLEFVSEPTKIQRQRLGIFVLMFLGILIVVTYLLHREYLKDIK